MKQGTQRQPGTTQRARVEREVGAGFRMGGRAHVYLWPIHAGIWQNLAQYRWRRHWHPTPVLLPGKSYGRRNLVGYGPWGR